MPQLSGLLETSLYVEDLERSSRFYRTLFGFESLFADTRLHALSVTGGHVLLLFKKRGSLELSTPHDGDGNLHVAFAIPASELEGLARCAQREKDSHRRRDALGAGRAQPLFSRPGPSSGRAGHPRLLGHLLTAHDFWRMGAPSTRRRDRR